MEVRDFVERNGGEYHEQVIEYCQICINTIKNDKGFENNFRKYDVTISEFLNLLLKKSQENLNKKNNEALDKKEFDKVFQNVVFYNEMTHFIADEEEHIKFASIDKIGHVEYHFDPYAIKFFKEKYKVDLSKYNN